MSRTALLAAFLGLACALAAHSGVTTRATRASPPRSCATPAATPAALGPFEVAGAVPISLTIENAGEQDRLLGGNSPVATSVEPHQTRLVDGRRVMEAAPGGIVIPGEESLVLESARSHLMLLGLTADLVQGEAFPLTLRFEQAGEATVTVRVRRKVDAAGIEPIPPVAVGDLTLSLASAPPSPAQPAACRGASGDS